MFFTAREIAAEISRELRDNPQAWHRGAFSNAPDKRVDAVDATAWCLSGHLRKRGQPTWGPIYVAFADETGIGSVCQWNDMDDRTVDEVIALCDRVAEAA
jgi:hypothetical protein